MNTRSIQWLNDNQYRAYPFIEDANLAYSVGTLPNTVFLDFSSVNFLFAPVAIKLMQFEVISSGGNKSIVFTVRYDGMQALPYGEIDILVPGNGATPYTTVVNVTNAYRITATLGEGIQELALLIDGIYPMTDPPEYEPITGIFQPGHRVDSVAGTKTGETDALVGDVYLREGYNCSITLQGTDTVRIAAGRGEGAGISCTPYAEEDILCQDVLLRINGLRANDLGNFALLAGPGASVSSSGNVITFKGAYTIGAAQRECG